MRSKIQPQLATLVDSPPEGPDWVHEIKFDGYRIIAVVTRSHVRLLTRSGLDWTAKMMSVASALKVLRLKEAILDGEVIAEDRAGNSDFQILQQSFKTHDSEKMQYRIFDILSFNGKDLRDDTLDVRRKILENALPDAKGVIQISKQLKGSGKSSFDFARRNGLEGIISKRKSGTYVSGRSKNWLKTKNLNNQEFIIVGYTAPSGSRKHFGSLLLAAYNSQHILQYVGKTGTGFDEDKLISIKRKLDRITVQKQPRLADSAGSLAGVKEATWVKPILIAQVKFATWTRDEQLRQCVFLELREDKKAGEVRVDNKKLATKK